jgi:transposase-like protein
LCLIVYYDSDVKLTQLYRLTSEEVYEQVREDLGHLVAMGFEIASVTCDGQPGTLRAIRAALPGVVIQRCLVHVHRQMLTWLTQRPQTLAAQELRHIAFLLPKVSQEAEKNLLFHMLLRWYKTHKELVNEKTYHAQTDRWWYKHRNLRRSYQTLKRAWPNLFAYLKDPAIPHSTNGLESFFGHLKGTLQVHRGLTDEHRRSFIRWYLHLRNERRLKK